MLICQFLWCCSNNHYTNTPVMAGQFPTLYVAPAFETYSNVGHNPVPRSSATCFTSSASGWTLVCCIISLQSETHCYRVDTYFMRMAHLLSCTDSWSTNTLLDSNAMHNTLLHPSYIALYYTVYTALYKHSFALCYSVVPYIALLTGE